MPETKAEGTWYRVEIAGWQGHAAAQSDRIESAIFGALVELSESGFEPIALRILLEDGTEVVRVRPTGNQSLIVTCDYPHTEAKGETRTMPDRMTVPCASCGSALTVRSGEPINFVCPECGEPIASETGG